MDRRSSAFRGNRSRFFVPDDCLLYFWSSKVKDFLQQGMFQKKQESTSYYGDDWTGFVELCTAWKQEQNWVRIGAKKGMRWRMEKKESDRMRQEEVVDCRCGSSRWPSVQLLHNLRFIAVGCLICLNGSNQVRLGNAVTGVLPQQIDLFTTIAEKDGTDAGVTFWRSGTAFLACNTDTLHLFALKSLHWMMQTALVDNRCCKGKGPCGDCPAAPSTRSLFQCEHSV